MSIFKRGDVPPPKVQRPSGRDDGMRSPLDSINLDDIEVDPKPPADEVEEEDCGCFD